jgi:hypothetical protein
VGEKEGRNHQSVYNVTRGLSGLVFCVWGEGRTRRTFRWRDCLMLEERSWDKVLRLEIQYQDLELGGRLRAMGG